MLWFASENAVNVGTSSVECNSSDNSPGVRFKIQQEVDNEEESKEWRSRDFQSFPYQPYAIQTDFMRNLYRSLEKGGIGLFESPTGTGKTLSIICAALEWLEAMQTKEKSQEENLVANDVEDEPLWARDFAADDLRTKSKERMEKRAKRLENIRAGIRRKKQKKFKIRHGEDADLLLEDAELDSSETEHEDLHARSSSSASEDGSEEDTDLQDKSQIIFCSRTHSQLAQFIGELKKTRFADSVSVVTLASRKVLCVNESVMKQQNLSRINESCRELNTGKPKTKEQTQTGCGRQRAVRKSAGCPYMQHDHKKQLEFTDNVLATPMDVEDLGRLAQRSMVCPYFGTRRAVLEADVLLLPYATLLHSETRKALGIRLRGNVVIFDEAHNLVDAVNNTHGASLNGFQMQTSISMVCGYLDRFGDQLSVENATNVQLLVKVCEALGKCLNGGKDSGAVFSVNQFLFEWQMDNICMGKIVRWAHRSKMTHKISGYAQTCGMFGDGLDNADRLSCLYALLGFIEALHNDDNNGRIIMQTESSDKKTLSFILLNAATHFEQVISESHAVVLASGTLSPVSLLTQQLVPGVRPERIVHFACGHVVSPDRLMALSMGKGPSGSVLDFRHKQRDRKEQMDEAGWFLLRLCESVPEGMVVFVSSFGYAEQLCAHWKKTGAFSRIQAKKKLFIEPKGSVAAEDVLKKYTRCIEQGGGAVLLSVVGGKMSEGINFGDGLGRCVLILGLPYANITDVALQERMGYMDGKARMDPDTSMTGHQYYEELCMKAVNQCVGRVIRHAKDYAVIILADTRYADSKGPGIIAPQVAKLPNWIKGSYIGSCEFEKADQKVREFFKGVNQEQEKLSEGLSLWK